MKIRIVTIMISAILGGCEPAINDPQSIRFQAGACFGTCPVWIVTLSSDGQGIFRGLYHTSFKGERRFRVPPESFGQIIEILRPIKPKRGSIPRKVSCNVGDGSSRTVVWIGDDGSEQSLCLGLHNEIADSELVFKRWNAAVRQLPITPWVGAIDQPPQAH